MGQFETRVRGMDVRFTPPDETPQDEARLVAQKAEELRRQKAETAAVLVEKPPALVNAEKDAEQRKEKTRQREEDARQRKAARTNGRAAVNAALK